MDADIQKRLREKFETSRIGLKPKITCPACTKSQIKACDKHPKAKCTSLRGEPGCQQWITPQHMHIEFVSHADVTDRLLAVDPEWTWEPVAFAANGLPALTPDGGLWIRLTVAGVTRIGYGGADGKTGDDGVKEAVSDAIKVTAMRFGVALDLWRKSEVSGKPSEDEDTAPPATQARPPQQRTNGQPQRPAPQETPAEPPAPPKTPAQARAVLAATCAENGWDLGIVAARFESDEGVELGKCTDRDVIVRFRASLFAVSDGELRKQPAANGASR